ncbi:MAG: hypothetical protein IT225_01720 [Flavobacteriales bacterium]|nr:hypothetical protein [Flavobacteriales bacterium]
MVQAARADGDVAVRLIVDRHNKARGPYERNGSVEAQDEVIDIGHGMG